MKYWTLFTLRMVARVTLVLSLLIWVGGHSGRFRSAVAFSGMCVDARVESSDLMLHCASGMIGFRPKHGLPDLVASPKTKHTFRPTLFIDSSGPDPNRAIAHMEKTGYTIAIPGDLYEPLLAIPGVTIWTDGKDAGAIRVSHWLLCLAFLVATIATWPRKKQEMQQESSE